MLLPDFEIVHQRWTDMGSPFAEVFGWIDEEIRLRTPREGLWLDTSTLSPEDAVATIIERLEESAVT
jgi:hypothetical protein